jgi:hypothetical protein
MVEKNEKMETGAGRPESAVEAPPEKRREMTTDELSRHSREWLKWLGKLCAIPKTFEEARGRSAFPETRERALRYVDQLDDEARDLTPEEEEQLAPRASPHK